MNVLKLPKRSNKVDVRICYCGHVATAHADRGSGPCQGVYSVFDTAEVGPCTCHTFTEVRFQSWK